MTSSHSLGRFLAVLGGLERLLAVLGRLLVFLAVVHGHDHFTTRILIIQQD